MRYQGNWDDIIKGPNGNPLRLYHGTDRDFIHFELAEMVDVGIHFGCVAQADYFAADKPGGRIIPAYIRSLNSVDVGNHDFGWKWPNQTIRSLENTIYRKQFLFSTEDIEALGFSRGLSLGQAYEKDCDFVDASQNVTTLKERCRAINRKIEKVLRGKGVDCIIYTNRNEPNDGIGRDAYLVLNPQQVISAIDYEILGA